MIMENSTLPKPAQALALVAGGGTMGADVAIEAVGIPGSFELCTRLVRPVGRVDTISIPILLAMLASKGTSVLRSVYVINRGYEDLAARLNDLGASIETFRDI